MNVCACGIAAVDCEYHKPSPVVTQSLQAYLKTLILEKYYTTRAVHAAFCCDEPHYNEKVTL
jgi:hypothetical protein